MNSSFGQLCFTLGLIAIQLAASGDRELFAAEEPRNLTVSPKQIKLVGPEDSQQLLVTSISPTLANNDPQRQLDLTRLSKFVVDDAQVVRVNRQGQVVPLRDGKTVIEVRVGKQSRQVPVTVVNFERPARLSFRHDIVPILSKAGCNSGGCHGKAEGQNGFKLSVFGFDPQAGPRRFG